MKRPTKHYVIKNETDQYFEAWDVDDNNEEERWGQSNRSAQRFATKADAEKIFDTLRDENDGNLIVRIVESEEVTRLKAENERHRALLAEISELPFGINELWIKRIRVALEKR